MGLVCKVEKVPSEWEWWWGLWLGIGGRKVRQLKRKGSSQGGQRGGQHGFQVRGGGGVAGGGSGGGDPGVRFLRDECSGDCLPYVQVSGVC